MSRKQERSQKAFSSAITLAATDFQHSIYEASLAHVALLLLFLNYPCKRNLFHYGTSGSCWPRPGRQKMTRKRQFHAGVREKVYTRSSATVIALSVPDADSFDFLLLFGASSPTQERSGSDLGRGHPPWILPTIPAHSEFAERKTAGGLECGRDRRRAKTPRGEISKDRLSISWQLRSSWPPRPN